MEAQNAFLGDGTNLIPPRIALHLESTIGIGSKMNVQPKAHYNLQAGASEVNAGLILGYELQPSLELSLGGGMRLGDAVFVVLGGEYKGVKLGLSYDANNSELKSAGGTGAIELLLGYTGSVFKKADPILPAIRFF